ncbi:MAG: hypothetical protein O7F08_00685, partial [Deltaproteobacteria bacterium]|nr:hypothetical protein [Deltaproteobacteria bacterium]
AVIGSDHYSDDLRTQAALAMVEMDRSDVSGLNLLRGALDQLRRGDPQVSEMIVAGMVPRLEALLAEEAESSDNGALQVQIRAKDAAYMVISYAPEESRTTLTRSVVGWYSRDFEGRSLAGDYSAEQVTRALGAEAAGMLVDALHEKMSPLAMIKIAEIIGEDGDDETKERAAKRLVEIEREVEKPRFVQWLGAEIRKSLEASGEPLNDARVASVAVYNRESYINNGVLSAMKYLADQDVVSFRLLQIADTKPGANDSKAWVERLNGRRATALRALEGHVSRTHLNRLLSIALDPSNSIEVRDYAFDRVGDIRSRRAIPRLWPLVQRRGCTAASCTSAAKLDKRLRWRAGELVLSLGGPSTIKKFSQQLPIAPGIQYDPEELEGYATRMSHMTPPPTSTVLTLLDSQHWWNRVVGLRYLERRGGVTDVPAMKRLVTDTAEVAGEGWSELNPPAKQVGDVAKAAIDALQTREQGDNKK